MEVRRSIRNADRWLGGRPARWRGLDARWQAVIAVSDFIETNPEEVWEFAKRWGSIKHEDLQAAIGTCILEHLLEYHFDLIFPRLEAAVRENRNLARTFGYCWKFGQSEEPQNSSRMDKLREEVTEF